MRGLACIVMVMATVACGTTVKNSPVSVADKRDPGAETVNPNLPGNTGNTGDDGGGGPDSDRPTAEHRSDFEPCEPTIESQPAGNYDRYSFEDPKTGLVGFKNSAGAVVIPATYRFAYEFGTGGIAAAVDGTTPFVFIDSAGKVIAKAYAYDNGPDYFQDGLARIVDPRGKIGFIDNRGKIVITPQFDDAASFCHGKAEVAAGGKTFVIDRAGKTVAP